MALELVDGREIEITGALPSEWAVAGAYYLGYGRNAWHSTWVNIYIPRSVAIDFGELKTFAEKLRTQGSVFKIQSIPILVLKYPRNTFGIAPINDGGKYEYDKLIAAISKDALQNFWKYLPTRSQNWLLSFCMDANAIEVAKTFSPILFGGHSGGTQHSLAWATKRPAPDYKQFLNFADQLSALFSAKPNG